MRVGFACSLADGALSDRLKSRVADAGRGLSALGGGPKIREKPRKGLRHHGRLALRGSTMTPLAPPENDFALLDRFANHGDEEAFAEIVRRYAGVVYATSYRVVQDRGRAEDVAQEVFFKLLR